MRILVLGAGAVGGYFGGRLAQAGADVTFLVRPKRKAQLEKDGLTIKSPAAGDFVAPVRAMLTEEIKKPFDLILLSCKAYDLSSAIASIKPAVGPESAILPLLNGMRHLDVLGQSFAPEQVMGGLCFIAATLGANNEILHLNDSASITYGELDGRETPRVRELSVLMKNAKCASGQSSLILQDMWEKWVFLSTLGAATCLMRGGVGDIIKAGGHDFIMTLLEETRAIADACGHPQRPHAYASVVKIMTDESSAMTASMMRDMEARGRIEAEQIVGDMIARGAAAEVPTPALSLAYLHLKTFMARKEREW